MKISQFIMVKILIYRFNYILAYWQVDWAYGYFPPKNLGKCGYHWFYCWFLSVLLTKMFNEVHFMLYSFIGMVSSLVLGLLTYLFAGGTKDELIGLTLKTYTWKMRDKSIDSYSSFNEMDFWMKPCHFWLKRSIEKSTVNGSSICNVKEEFPVRLKEVFSRGCFIYKECIWMPGRYLSE